jgi:hypothetical protein
VTPLTPALSQYKVQRSNEHCNRERERVLSCCQVQISTCSTFGSLSLCRYPGSNEYSYGERERVLSCYQEQISTCSTFCPLSLCRDPGSHKYSYGERERVLSCYQVQISTCSTFCPLSLWERVRVRGVTRISSFNAGNNHNVTNVKFVINLGVTKLRYQAFFALFLRILVVG